MAYLNCGHCGLEIRIQAAYLLIQNCPRCRARSATVAPMTLSANGVADLGVWGHRVHDDRDPARGELNGR